MIIRLFKTLVFGNLFVAICAYFLSAEELFFDNKIRLANPLCLLIFFSTLLIYNYTGIFNKSDAYKVSFSQKSEWVFKHRFQITILAIIALFGIFISLFYLNKTTLFFLFPLFIVSVLYATPINLKKNSKFRLRQLPFLKVFLIAFIWSCVSYILPYIEYAPLTFKSYDHMLKFSNRFLFVLAIALPFDIRDMETDRRDGIKTLPILLGEKKSKLLAIFFLILFCGICLLQIINNEATEQIKNAAYLVSGILSIAMVALVDRHKGDLFYSFWIEGLLVLQFILLLIFRLVFF